jgi:putative glycosyltransferase (TIGR04348 family)
MAGTVGGKMAPMSRPRVRIVSPALASANNGNWHTAARWQRMLAAQAEVDIALGWDGEPVDALIALHARRSADAIARWHAAHPAGPLAVVLTGTDLYRDLAEGDASAAHSLKCASHLVVLQPAALRRLDDASRGKARVVLQSAPVLLRSDKPADVTAFAAVGHLRGEKDPATLMRAVLSLPDSPPMSVVHVGGALDEHLADEARRTMARCPRYRWLGGLPPGETRELIARAHALVHPSRMEGGANVVIEALRSRVPVLASRIDGNVGLLGEDYDGYFDVGDASALAGLMRRFAAEPAFAAGLGAQCAAREPMFAPEAEEAAVKGLLDDMLRGAATMHA